ncbi:CCR4 [Scenedesmus sp. PABB004]|nr:CCR4 [Scenedesmus sp. PABB004]
MARQLLPLGLGLGAAVLGAAGALIHKLARSDGGDDAAGGGEPALLAPRGSLATTGAADELSVVSYNVLADCFAAKHGEYVPEEQLDWRAYRWPLLQEQLLSWQADVVCLQEVDVLALPEWLEFAAAAGYAAVQQDAKGKQAVCLTLYRAAKLQLWWSDARSRTLLAALLFTDSSGASQVIYVANCHLEGSPRKPAERLAQARSALASLARHQQSAGLPPSECHVVFTGDLNSGRSEAVWRLLSQGWLPAGYCERHLPTTAVLPEGVEDATQPYLLADAYAQHPLPFTRKVPALSSCLDWLFVSTTMSVVALLWPLDEGDASDRRLPHSRVGLPNARHPSDHLPIGAKLCVLPAGITAITAMAQASRQAARRGGTRWLLLLALVAVALRGAGALNLKAVCPDQSDRYCYVKDAWLHTYYLWTVYYDNCDPTEYDFAGDGSSNADCYIRGRHSNMISAYCNILGANCNPCGSCGRSYTGYSTALNKIVTGPGGKPSCVNNVDPGCNLAAGACDTSCTNAYTAGGCAPCGATARRSSDAVAPDATPSSAVPAHHPYHPRDPHHPPAPSPSPAPGPSPGCGDMDEVLGVSVGELAKVLSQVFCDGGFEGDRTDGGGGFVGFTFAGAVLDQLDFNDDGVHSCEEYKKAYPEHMHRPGLRLPRPRCKLSERGKEMLVHINTGKRPARR